MRIPAPIKNLIEAFERLPGIGPKTAQRLTFYLLHVPQEELDMLSHAVSKLKKDIKICSVCKNVGESDPCEVCTDESRDGKVVAVVESSLDVLALERAGYKGLYHVLHGVISPLNNIGPEDLYINDLIKRIVASNSSEEKNAHTYFTGDVLETSLSAKKVPIEEIILATNTNMEGESTAMYITDLIKGLNLDSGAIKITRIARGLPVGGDIEYADDVTLKRALEGRINF